MAAHRAAVRAGLAYLDTHAGLSRRGTDGTEQVGSAGLVAAVFDHRSSRAGDPQLHSHALVLNKVKCVDGRWRTIDATELFHHKKSAGMIYQAALRNEMHQRLGVSFGEVNENGQADIAGVPDELLKLWSKRTAKIDAEAAPKIAEYEKLLGRTLSASERVGVVKTAVLKTRARKQHPELSALHASWTAEAARAGWTPDRLRRAVGLRTPPGRARQEPRVLPSDLTGQRSLARPRGPVRPDIDCSGPQATAGVLPVAGGSEPGKVAETRVAAAALHGAGTRRVFSRADVAGQVAALLPTSGLSAAEVVERVEQLTDVALGLDEAVTIGRQSVGVTPRASDARYATVQVLAAEARILELAGRGRRGGCGQVPLTALMPMDRDGRLDPSQYRAVVQLAGSGDFLSVLTAPAGAGKTSTLGAAARAWQDSGYRVVGVAPSARAAAELAAATGEAADTLAKWLHTHHTTRHNTPAGTPDGAQGAAALDCRTVVIVDEASMASTLDLDPLITAAAGVGAKVVLIGDPAQIGVINGPGGMLAALGRAGHGVELDQIHRFSQPWKRQASLALRHGQADALLAYRTAGRLHPCRDGDAALDGVFAHWAEARAEGQDALMLARTRLDVDALNIRARAAALAAGQITGPVTAAGGRDWQAGDVLRTRRNDRRLSVGDGHVRNGDRYRVLGAGPQDGLIVEDLTGRGRTVLPAAYLAEHVEYGWASTIDAAQGATADVGVVLVRPGMDREHLYVAMTRGRHGNHAYITPDPVADDDHHGHPHPRAGVVEDPQEQAVRELQAALARTGAQDAAHTALEHARTQAAPTARQNEHAAERAAARERVAEQAQRRQSRPLSAEHGSSRSAGPNASSCVPTATRCTEPCGRPAMSSTPYPGGPAGAAAPLPTPSPAASSSCSRARRPSAPWTPRSTGSPAKSPTTPGSARPATWPQPTAAGRTGGTRTEPPAWPGPGRPRPAGRTCRACWPGGSRIAGPSGTSATASAGDPRRPWSAGPYPPVTSASRSPDAGVDVPTLHSPRRSVATLGDLLRTRTATTQRIPPSRRAPRDVGSTEHRGHRQHRQATSRALGDPMLLTVDQAAERLGTTTRFIRRLRAERRIAVVKLGKHIRIDSNDLDAYIAASRQEPDHRAS